MTSAADTPDARLCVMFYLPVVTPWWFANIVVHLIRVMARVHEVHVLIPPLWRGTGLSNDQLGLIDDLDHVHWHLLDGTDHPKLREDASEEEDLFELVEAIAPDLTLCRSADTRSPERFPGMVRYIMEGAAPPLATGPAWVMLSEALFDYGTLPAMSPSEAGRLDALGKPLVASVAPRTDTAAWRALHGLGVTQTVIGLPLEYEHEENFFGQHHRYADNAEMITVLANLLPEGAVLAVTNHPLNDLYGDNTAIEAAIAAHAGSVVMLPSGAVAGKTTEALAQHCDAMVVGNSKCWAVAAAYGTPFLRLSDFVTGEWANAYTSIETFFADLAAGSLATADPILARRWFAYHLADAIFDPLDPQLTAADITARVNRPVDPARWVRALAHHHTLPLGEAA